MNASNIKTEMETFKGHILKTAEDMVVNKFPSRVVMLNKMLVSNKLTRDPSSVFQKVNIPIPDVTDLGSSVSPAPGATHSDSKKQTADQTQAATSNGESEVSNPITSDDASLLNSTKLTSLTLQQPNAKKRKYSTCPAHLDSVVGTKVLVLPDGVVPSNHFIVELINEIKPLISELVEDTNLLKMWLMYLIPRIEDGNNFGVSIQEDVLAEIRASEGEAAAYYDQISRYFSVRGKTVSKIAQYPHIDDYRMSIKELDEKEFFSLRLIVAELRNHYATLHDLITKNGDKIRKPRSSNAENMF